MSDIEFCSIVATVLMVYGCIFMYPSPIYHRTVITGDPLVLQVFGNTSLLADARSDIRSMVVADEYGHMIDVASVYATNAENVRFAARVLTAIHIYHLVSVQGDWRSDTLWTGYNAFYRACYTMTAVMFGLIFLIDCLHSNPTSDISFMGHVLHAIGGAFASFLIVATYICAPFSLNVPKSEKFVEADLARCTDGI